MIWKIIYSFQWHANVIHTLFSINYFIRNPSRYRNILYGVMVFFNLAQAHTATSYLDNLREMKNIIYCLNISNSLLTSRLTKETSHNYALGTEHHVIMFKTSGYLHICLQVLLCMSFAAFIHRVLSICFSAMSFFHFSFAVIKGRAYYHGKNGCI